MKPSCLCVDVPISHYLPSLGTHDCEIFANLRLKLYWVTWRQSPRPGQSETLPANQCFVSTTSSLATCATCYWQSKNYTFRAAALRYHFVKHYDSRQHLIRSTGRKHSLVYHAFPVVAQFCLDVNIAFGRVLFWACYSHSSAKQKLQYSNFRNHPRGHHFLPTFHSCRRSATDSMSLLFLGFIDNKSPSLAPSPLLPRPEAGEDMLIFSDISFN